MKSHFHTLLEPNMDIKARDRWSKSNKYKLTDAEKLVLFDKIVAEHKKCSAELTAYFYDKRCKNRVKKARIARGYVPKGKTKKEDYAKA